MWYLFWIETSRQFRKEELVQLEEPVDAEQEKDELEGWCKDVYELWDVSDAHISYGYERLSDLLGIDYAPTPKGLREWLVNTLAQNAHFEIWQDRPYTAVSVITRLEETYQRLGFSKAHWPDKWDATHGIDLATNKAISKMAKDILSNRLREVRHYFKGLQNAS